MKDARIRRGKPAVASRFCKDTSSSFISGSTPARAIQVHMHLIITYSCSSRSLRWPGPKERREMRKNLKNTRRKAGMTQQQVAEYLGITLRSYQRIESGELLGSIAHWDALEDLFKIHQRVLRLETCPEEVTEKLQ